MVRESVRVWGCSKRKCAFLQPVDHDDLVLCEEDSEGSKSEDRYDYDDGFLEKDVDEDEDIASVASDDDASAPQSGDIAGSSDGSEQGFASRDGDDPARYSAFGRHHR